MLRTHSRAYPIQRRTFYKIIQFDIAGIRNDLASAAVHGFGHIHIAGIRIDDEHLIGKQTSGDISRICFHADRGGITAVECDITRASFNEKAFFCNDVTQRDIACISV